MSKCKHKSCKKEYTKRSAFQVACSVECAIAYNSAKKEKAKAKEEKAFRKETRRLKQKIKSKGEWAKEAQAAFNKFIRLRDAKDPCISCGRHHQGQYHAGHFMTVGAHPELRFEELNNHKQCAPCNNHLSGNIIRYRQGLIEKIGFEKVEWLEGPHEPKRYRKEDLEAIKKLYTKLARELNDANNI